MQGQRKVILYEKLADWSAAYLAMWKALESFDPKSDRWSEPIDFGSSGERIRAAENAVSRARQRHGTDEEKERDVQSFQDHVARLASGAPFNPDQAGFANHVRRIGSALADQSVVAAQTAER